MVSLYESASFSLTSLEKRIIAIAAVVFLSMAAVYFAVRAFSKWKATNEVQVDKKDGVSNQGGVLIDPQGDADKTKDLGLPTEILGESEPSEAKPQGKSKEPEKQKPQKEKVEQQKPVEEPSLPEPSGQKSGSADSPKDSKEIEESNFSVVVDALFHPGIRTKAKEITLREFRDLDETRRQKMIETYSLQADLDSFGLSAFFQKLDKLDDNVLECCRLWDVMIGIENSRIRFFFLTDEEFEMITVRQLDFGNEEQILYAFQRRRLVSKEQKESIPRPHDILDARVVQLDRLSVDDINTFIENLPPRLCYFLSDAQMRRLNFDLMTDDQIDQLFCHRFGAREDRRRMALVPVAQITGNLVKLNGYQVYLLSDDQVKGITLSNLTKDQINHLFSSKEGEPEDKRRFELLPASQINVLMDKLDEYHVYLLSDEQLRQVDCSRLTAALVKQLFSSREGKQEDERRFALLKAEQVDQIIDKMDGYQMYLLSEKHLRKVNFAALNEARIKLLFSSKEGFEEDKRRFALLPVDQVKGILGKLDASQIPLLSDDHLRQADLSKVPPAHLKALFSTKKENLEESKRRFALLSSDQMNHIFDHLDEAQVYLLTDEHLRHVNLSKGAEAQIPLLFSGREGTKEDKRRFAFLPVDQVNAILPKLNDYQMYLISDKQLENIDLKPLHKDRLPLFFSSKEGPEEDLRRFKCLQKEQKIYVVKKLPNCPFKTE
jgi:hypothetical protein